MTNEKTKDEKKQGGIFEGIKEFFTMGLTTLRNFVKNLFSPVQEPEPEKPEEITKEVDESTGLEEKSSFISNLIAKEVEEKRLDEEDQQLIQEYQSLYPTFNEQQKAFIEKLFRRFLEEKQKRKAVEKMITKFYHAVGNYTVKITCFVMADNKTFSFTKTDVQVEDLKKLYVVPLFKESYVYSASSYDTDRLVSTSIEEAKKEIVDKKDQILQRASNSIYDQLRSYVFTSAFSFTDTYLSKNVSKEEFDVLFVENIQETYMATCGDFDNILRANGISKDKIINSVELSITDKSISFNLTKHIYALELKDIELEGEVGKRMVKLMSININIEGSINIQIRTT